MMDPLPIDDVKPHTIAQPEQNPQNELQEKIEQVSNNLTINEQEQNGTTENSQEDNNGFNAPLLKERNKKRKFTAEEDEKLRELVQSHGQKQWDVIARSIGSNRTARQCRDRWKHYLSPNVSQKEWTITEDRLLLQYTQKYGAQWAALVKFFPGRTDINLKNRWNKLQRKSRKLFQTNPNVQIPKLPANPEHIHLLNPANMILNQNQSLTPNVNEDLTQTLVNQMCPSLNPLNPIIPTTVSPDNKEELQSNDNSHNNNISNNDDNNTLNDSIMPNQNQN